MQGRNSGRTKLERRLRRKSLRELCDSIVANYDSITLKYIDGVCGDHEYASILSRLMAYPKE